MLMSLHSRGFCLCGILGILWFLVLHSLWVNFCMFCKIVVAVQAPRHVSHFATPWTGAHQASLSFTVFQSLLTLVSMESVMPSDHLILCCPLLLPSTFPSIKVFSNESALCIRWPKYWSFSFSISPSNEYSVLISLELTGLKSLLFKGLSRVFSNTTVWKHQFISAQPFLRSNSHIRTWLLEKP